MRIIYYPFVILLIAQCGTSTVPREGEFGQKLTNDKIGLIHDGIHYGLDQSFTGSGEMVFGRSTDASDSLILAADGQYLSAVILANEGFDAVGGITGISTNKRMPDIHTFSGEYRLISADDTYLNNQTQEINLTANFDLGTVKGSSVNDPKGEFVSQFRGIIHAKDIEMYFLDQTGLHQGEGNFYGPNGEEFAAYYVSDKHGGMVYALQN